MQRLLMARPRSTTSAPPGYAVPIDVSGPDAPSQHPSASTLRGGTLTGLGAGSRRRGGTVERPPRVGPLSPENHSSVVARPWRRARAPPVASTAGAASGRANAFFLARVMLLNTAPVRYNAGRTPWSVPHATRRLGNR